MFKAAVAAVVEGGVPLQAGDNPKEAFPADTKFRVVANARLGSLIKMGNEWVNCGWFEPLNAAAQQFHGAHVDENDGAEDHLNYAPLPRQVVARMLHQKFFRHNAWTLGNGAGLSRSEQFNAAWAAAVGDAYKSTPSKPRNFKKLGDEPAGRYRWDVKRTKLMLPANPRVPACMPLRNQRSHLLDILKILRDKMSVPDVPAGVVANPFLSEASIASLAPENNDEVDIAFLEANDLLTNPDIQRTATFRQVNRRTTEYTFRFTTQPAAPAGRARRARRRKFEKELVEGRVLQQREAFAGGDAMPTESGMAWPARGADGRYQERERWNVQNGEDSEALEDPKKLRVDSAAEFDARAANLAPGVLEAMNVTGKTEAAIQNAALKQGVVLVPWSWVLANVDAHAMDAMQLCGGVPRVAALGVRVVHDAGVKLGNTKLKPPTPTRVWVGVHDSITDVLRGAAQAERTNDTTVLLHVPVAGGGVFTHADKAALFRARLEYVHDKWPEVTTVNVEGGEEAVMQTVLGKQSKVFAMIEYDAMVKNRWITFSTGMTPQQAVQLFDPEADEFRSTRSIWAAVDVAKLGPNNAPAAALLAVLCAGPRAAKRVQVNPAAPTDVNPYAATAAAAAAAAANDDDDDLSQALDIESFCKSPDAPEFTGQLLMLLVMLRNRGEPYERVDVKVVREFSGAKPQRNSPPAMHVAALYHAVFKFQRAFNDTAAEVARWRGVITDIAHETNEDVNDALADWDVMRGVFFQPAYVRADDDDAEGYLMTRPYPSLSDIRSILSRVLFNI